MATRKFNLTIIDSKASTVRIKTEPFDSIHFEPNPLPEYSNKQEYLEKVNEWNRLASLQANVNGLFYIYHL